MRSGATIVGGVNETPDVADPAPPDAAVPVGAESTAGSTAESTAAAQTERTPADLDAIARDLDGVDAALKRLDDGTYWTDEVTGEPIPDEVLAADPVARRAAPSRP